jgi:hypothetical protein
MDRSMMPAVEVPEGAARTPIDVKLKPKWRYDASRRTFTSVSGDTFSPHGSLPPRSKIVYKVPSLAGADEARLSPPERELSRHMQVILPASEPPAKYLDVVRAWPPIEAANLGPNVSLP